MKTLVSLMMVAISLVVSSEARADQPGVHGMLLFGDQVTYASHLPMFHPPHDYQVLLKLVLHNKSGTNTLALYEQAKKDTSTYLTLVPEVMDLTQVISGAKTSFAAAVYKGHFERGGQNLGQVRVEVSQVLYSAKIAAQQVPSSDQYLAFGSNGEYYAMHLIVGRPSFDAIVGIGQPYKVQTTFCRTRACAEPGVNLIEDSKLPIVLDDSGIGNVQKKIPAVDDSLGSLSGALSTIQKVIYVEEGDLSE